MNHKHFLLTGVLICSLYISGNCESYCDSLNENQMLLFTSIQKVFRIPQCSDMTLESALIDSGKCAIASRLSQYGAWLTYLNRDSVYIVNKLAKRNESLSSKKRYEINEKLFETAGDKNAPVTIAVYISISCPYCKTFCSLLYDLVTAGYLEGKAKLCVKLLSATDRDMALLAAHGFKKFWEYMNHISTIKRRLDLDVLLEAALDLNIPPKAFQNYMENPSVRAHALESREEGLRNGVKVTPTVFINNRKYESHNDPIWIIDAVEHEYEQVSKDNSK